MVDPPSKTPMISSFFPVKKASPINPDVIEKALDRSAASSSRTIIYGSDGVVIGREVHSDHVGLGDGLTNEHGSSASTGSRTGGRAGKETSEETVAGARGGDMASEAKASAVTSSTLQGGHNAGAVRGGEYSFISHEDKRSAHREKDAGIVFDDWLEYGHDDIEAARPQADHGAKDGEAGERIAIRAEGIEEFDEEEAEEAEVPGSPGRPTDNMAATSEPVSFHTKITSTVHPSSFISSASAPPPPTSSPAPESCPSPPVLSLGSLAPETAWTSAGDIDEIVAVTQGGGESSGEVAGEEPDEPEDMSDEAQAERMAAFFAMIDQRSQGRGEDSGMTIKRGGGRRGHSRSSLDSQAGRASQGNTEPNTDQDLALEQGMGIDSPLVGNDPRTPRTDRRPPVMVTSTPGKYVTPAVSRVSELDGGEHDDDMESDDDTQEFGPRKGLRYREVDHVQSPSRHSEGSNHNLAAFKTPTEETPPHPEHEGISEPVLMAWASGSLDEAAARRAIERYGEANGVWEHCLGEAYANMVVKAKISETELLFIIEKATQEEEDRAPASLRKMLWKEAGREPRNLASQSSQRKRSRSRSMSSAESRSNGGGASNDRGKNGASPHTRKRRRAGSPLFLPSDGEGVTHSDIGVKFGSSESSPGLVEVTPGAEESIIMPYRASDADGDDDEIECTGTWTLANADPVDANNIERRMWGNFEVKALRKAVIKHGCEHSSLERWKEIQREMNKATEKRSADVKWSIPLLKHRWTEESAVLRSNCADPVLRAIRFEVFLVGEMYLWEDPQRWSHVAHSVAIRTSKQGLTAEMVQTAWSDPVGERAQVLKETCEF